MHEEYRDYRQSRVYSSILALRSVSGDHGVFSGIVMPGKREHYFHRNKMRVRYEGSIIKPRVKRNKGV